MLERFREMYGMHWPNFLLQEIENYAKTKRMKWVVIRAPESLKWFKHPVGNKKEIQRRIISLYRKAAEKGGYKREGSFYIKRIS